MSTTNPKPTPPLPLPSEIEASLKRLSAHDRCILGCQIALTALPDIPAPDSRIDLINAVLSYARKDAQLKLLIILCDKLDDKTSISRLAALAISLCDDIDTVQARVLNLLELRAPSPAPPPTPSEHQS
jgi:hypothetical protein